MSSKKQSIGLMVALVGFPQISETIYTPALPKVAEALKTTAYMVESTLSIYFVGFALGVLIWGFVSDFVGRRPTMIIGLCLYGLATFFCGQTESVDLLLIARLVQAFGASVGSVITQTILRDAYNGDERSKLFSIISGALAFSPAIGPLLGGFITQFLGWRANFFSLAWLSVFLLFWTLLSLKETRPQNVPKQSLKGLKALAHNMLTSKQLLGHILMIGGTNGIIFGFYQEAPFVFIEQLGLSPTTYGCFGILIALATIFASRVCYKQNEGSGCNLIRLGSFCILGAAVFFSLLVISKIFFLPQIGLVLTILALFMIFFGIGLIIPNSFSTSLKAYQMSAGTAGSIFGGCYYSLIAASTWLMGMIHTGTALPLPLYTTLLGVMILYGSNLSQERSLSQGGSLN